MDRAVVEARIHPAIGIARVGNSESINVRSARQNSAIQGQERRGLIIDPGPRSISGDNQRSTPFDSGEFLGKKVYLRELLTDEGGRLVF
jgi:hypothetical protein